MDIKQAKVLITGGSSGIGLATAKMLKQQGAQVFICGRNADKLKEHAEAEGLLYMAADISDEAEVKKLFTQAITAMGGLNVLVNNAGVGHQQALIDTSLEDFTRVWETNVKGAFLCGKAAAAHFKQQNEGNIINVSSTAGLRGFAEGSSYVATKFAVSGLTECWRAELRKHNVRVMQVNPSEVITNFSANIGHDQVDNGRKLQPEDIAHTIVAMLSMHNRGFITDATVWATNP